MTQAREEQPPLRYVVGFCFSPDYEWVALIRKNKPQWQAGLLNGIGGKVEPGERKGMAMMREFKEEAGVLIPEYDWLHFRTEAFSTGARVHHFAHCATPDEWAAIRTMEAEEVGRVRADSIHLFPAVYNLPYLVPMARILLQYPARNRPLP